MSAGLTYSPTIQEVLAWFKYALRNDTVLRDWCEDKFGRRPKFFWGVNYIAPPEESDTPFIAVEADVHEGGALVQKEVYRVVVSNGIFNDQILVEENEATVVGCDQVTEMIYLVRNAIDAVLPPQLQVAECHIVGQNAYHMPMFYSQLEFFVQVPRCMGGAVTIPNPPA